MKYTIEQFAEMIDGTRSKAEAMDVVAKIIVEASGDTDLVEEAIVYINSKLDWASAIEKTMHHLELN